MSTVSSSKGVRWAFSGGLDKKRKLIHFPADTMKIKFEVQAQMETNAFGDVYQISITQQKSADRQKSMS